MLGCLGCVLGNWTPKAESLGCHGPAGLGCSQGPRGTRLRGRQVRWPSCGLGTVAPSAGAKAKPESAVMYFSAGWASSHRSQVPEWGSSAGRDLAFFGESPCFWTKWFCERSASARDGRTAALWSEWPRPAGLREHSRPRSLRQWLLSAPLISSIPRPCFPL